MRTLPRRTPQKRFECGAVRAMCMFGLLFGLVSGCGGDDPTGRVVFPAAVPVRAFPRIWVAGGHLDYEIAITDAVVAHLARARVGSVRRVEIDRLEPMRLAGKIPPATVVMLLDVEFSEDLRSEWTSRPETVCGPLGCYSRQRSYMYDVPTLLGRVTVKVFDGPRATVLQKVQVRAQDDGRDYASMRLRVVNRLIEKVAALVDQRVQEIEVELLDADHELVEAAIEAIEGGDWTKGRVLLERAAKSPETEAMDPEERARVYYDLSLARRFDPKRRGSAAQRYRFAGSPLAAAIRLDPEESLYREAMADLKDHREQRELVEQQRAATRHNFRLANQSAMPKPPSPYLPAANGPEEPAPGPPPEEAFEPDAAGPADESQPPASSAEPARPTGPQEGAAPGAESPEEPSTSPTGLAPPPPPAGSSR